MIKVVSAREIQRGDIIAEGIVIFAEPDARYGIVITVPLGQVKAKPGQKVIRFAKVSGPELRRFETMTTPPNGRLSL